MTIHDGEREEARATTLLVSFDDIFMEEGTKSKKTVFVGGIGDDADEGVIFEHFSTFGAFMPLFKIHQSLNLFVQEIS